PPVRSGARERRSEISSAIGNARAPAWLVHHELPSRSLPWPRRRQRVDLALATRPAPGASPPRSPFRMISLTHLSEPEPPPPAVLQDLPQPTRAGRAQRGIGAQISLRFAARFLENAHVAHEI